MGDAEIFTQYTCHLLKTLPALVMARQQGLGGPNSQEKVDWLCESVVQTFMEHADIYPDEIEDFISEALFNEFDTIAEDGSLVKLSTKLCGVYRKCREGKSSEVLAELEQFSKVAPLLQPVIKASEQDSDSDDDDGEDICNNESTTHTKSPTSNTVTTTSDKESRMDIDNEVDPDGW